MIEYRQTIRALVAGLVLGGLCVCLFGGLGCAVAAKSKVQSSTPVAAAAPASAKNPPIPQQLAVSNATARTTNRVDGDRAVSAPPKPKPWYFQWTGQTNGVVYVVGRKETLQTPWQVFARVTNRTEVIVTPGFYTVLQVEDLDNPNNVQIGK